MYYKLSRSDELYHHGVKGQKWGVRRYEKLKAKTRRAFGEVESYDEIISENKGSHSNKWDRKRDKAVKKANKLLSKEKALGTKQEKRNKRAKLMRDAADLASEVSKGHADNVKYYSNDKNRTGKSTKSDMKRWATASRNASSYFEKKANEFRNKSVGKISRKDVKYAKKWMKNNSVIEDAEYTDYFYGGKYYNYLNNLGKGKHSKYD